MPRHGGLWGLPAAAPQGPSSRAHWTPKAGRWFFDAGVGVNVGGKAHFAYVGLAGMARLGISFNNAPVSLSVDWTPSFGPRIGYFKEWSEAEFNDLALANLGVTCTFHF